MYLDYLRRVYPLMPDPTGQSRTIITQGFEAVLDAIGIDPDAGKFWREYIDFVKSGPGVIGGAGWQDQQKSDLVRKAYQRAVKVPMAQDMLSKLWKEYDQFEAANSSNKAQGRKNVQELGPHYMSAKQARHNFDRFFGGMDRRSLPMLPPLHGCEGEDQFADQVDRWKAWVEWEKADPVSLKDDEAPLYRKRVLYVLKQAVISLRFYPQMWFDAAQWCYETASSTPDPTTAAELVQQGDDFLEQGAKANPEAVLLCLKRVDRMETTKLDLASSDQDVIIANGDRLDIVFEDCHKPLYALKDKLVEREKKGIQAIREHFASLPPEEESEPVEQLEDDDDDETSPAASKPQSRQEQMAAQIKALQKISKARLEELKRTISFVWVAKMRTFRRVQGQGNPNTKRPKGVRGVFGEARPRGQLTSEVYVASALTEWHCYKDASALKIFERGLRLFPADEAFAEAYVRFLIEQKDDLVNARVVFETTVTKILGPQQPAAATTSTKDTKEQEEEDRKKKERVRGLLWYMHDFESKYSDMNQILKLEKRMKDLFPEESETMRFAGRFMTPHFDGMSVQLVLSESQAIPKTMPTAMVAQPPPAGPPSMMPGLPPVTHAVASPEQGVLRLGPNGPYMASEKRSLDDVDSDVERQRKFARAESPSKGAGNRRAGGPGNQSAVLGSLAQGPVVSGGSAFVTKNYVPPGAPQPAQQMMQDPAPLPKEINFLLSVLPRSTNPSLRTVTFDTYKFMLVLRSLDLNRVDPVAAQARLNEAATTVRNAQYQYSGPGR